MLLQYASTEHNGYRTGGGCYIRTYHWCKCSGKRYSQWDYYQFDGKFTLSVQKGETLHISYIGYVAQDVKIMGNQPVKVVMSEDTETLDEVVVVGTAMKKSDLTGAVASVSSKVLEEKPVTNVNQALQGRVAGVFISQPTRPTDDASIKIRGINTINGSTDPIYVVDGMVMDNSFSGFNAVNLNDVASIEVLKDASATALYGSRGSNGVVVITTKKGKKAKVKFLMMAGLAFRPMLILQKL